MIATLITQRNKSLRNGPGMNPGDDPRKAAAFMATGSLSPALDDSALNEQFATMSMSGHGKFQPGMKVPTDVSGHIKQVYTFYHIQL